MASSLKVSLKKVFENINGLLLLSDIEFEINGPGVIWIEGVNGAGKSLISSIVSGKTFFPSGDLTVEGKVVLNTQDGKNIDANIGDNYKEYSSNVSYWPQKKGSSLISIFHQDDICSGLESRMKNDNTNDPKLIQELKWLIEELDLSEYLLKNVDQCSYGETRRIELATALTTIPNLIVADEPFSGIDDHWKEILRKTIKIFTERYNCIWVITSHHSPKFYNVEVDQVVKLPEKKEDLAVFKSITDKFISKMTESSVSKANEIVLENISIIRKLPRFSEVRLRNFSATVKKIAWIQGSNGSGKSTISKLLGGLIYPHHFLKYNKTSITGTIYGSPYNGKFIKAPNDEVRIVLQDPYESFVRKNVAEDLKYSHCSGEYLFNNSMDINFYNYLESNWGILKRKSYTFSFGQLRFLQLLFIPVTASVIIFDEPFMGLHPNLFEIMHNTLQQLSSTGRIVIATRESNFNFAQSEDVHYLRKVS